MLTEIDVLDRSDQDFKALTARDYAGALDRSTAVYTSELYVKGNILCTLYHIGNYHLRHETGFTPLFKGRMAEYRTARQLNPKLTRAHFFKANPDYIAAFLSTYTGAGLLDSVDAAEIEWTTLRALISIVAPDRVKYAKHWDHFLDLEDDAHAHYCKIKRKESSTGAA